MSVSLGHVRVGAAALLLLAALVVPAPVAAAASPEPVSLVDPMIGTGSGGAAVGQVDTFPGPAVPFGMVQWSPDTPSRPSGGGYDHADSAITGFSLTHLSGAGCPVAGDVPFLPTVGAVGASPAATSQPFSHAGEHAAPGSYSVSLGSPAIDSALAVTARTGLGRFTYPPTDQANMLVKAGASAAGNSSASVSVLGDDTVAGSATTGHFCGAPDQYTVYFAARFDRPFTAHGTWTAAGVTPGSAQATDPQAGAWVTFDTRRDPTVEMKVGVSFVSLAGAEANLRAEGRTWDPRRLTDAARERWERVLGRVRVTGGTPAELTTFYTALYHSLLHPSLGSDADGRYTGFDGRVHRAASGHPWYVNFSGWDIYRSQVPLLALLAPRETSDMVTSLVLAAEQGGWLPKWGLQNGYTSVMNGDAADPIIASAHAFGARGFDVRRALAAMVRGAEDTTSPPGQGFYVERPQLADYLRLGYTPNVQATDISPVPNGASQTLEYSIDDFATAQLAAAAGSRDVARRLLARSQSWANLFDTTTGFLEPRDADGAFPPGPAFQPGGGFGQTGFQEGNAVQYAWEVPQDLRGLFDGMGGNAAVVARLDRFFTQLNAGPNQPFDWAGNEISLGTPWEYDYAGAPWRTQAVVRQIVTQLYAPTPGGEPGNDDLGSMSSWYVWAAMGLYPETPGTPVLALGSPLFTSVSIDRGDDRRIEIRAPGASDATPYVQSLKVNGRSTSRPWLSLRDAPAVTRLDFALGASPNPAWGAAAADAPPSYPAGPVRFPPSTAARLSFDPARVRLQAGAGAAVSIVVDDTAGTAPATVTWSAQVPAGLTLTPAAATVTAPAGQLVATAATLSAAAGARPGFSNVTFAARDGDGAVLRRETLAVTIASNGAVVPTAYVANFTDGSLTPIDVETNVAGPPIAIGAGPNDVIISPDGRRAYTANQNSNNVSVIDTVANSVVATVDAGNQPAGITITPDGRTVWIGDFGSGQVVPLDTATDTVGAPIAVGTNPQTIAVSPDGRRLWVVNQGNSNVSVIDLASRTVVQTIPVGSQPYGLAITPDGSRVYVADGGSNDVTPIDAATGAAGPRIPVGSLPQGISISPDGALAYVCNFGGTTVTPIHLATSTPDHEITVGGAPYQAAFAHGGTTAYVINTSTNDVTPVDVATGQTGSHIPVGNAPDGIWITPGA